MGKKRMERSHLVLFYGGERELSPVTGRAGCVGGVTRGQCHCSGCPTRIPKRRGCFTTVLKEDAVTYQLREKNK